MTIRRKGTFKNSISKLENGINRGLILAAMKVAQEATRRSPRDTGRLKRSISYGYPFKLGPAAYGIAVGTNVIYARAQEFGSGIHSEDPSKRHYIKIRAVKAKSLAFKWPNAPAGLKPGPGGKYYFISVNHPGVRPQPYLRPALRASRKYISNVILKSVVGALKQ